MADTGPAVIDATMIYNEVPYLAARVALGAGVIDRHVVVEGDRDHHGRPKPPCAGMHDWPDHVEVHTTVLPEAGEPRMRERVLRHSALAHIDAEPDDVVLILDIDEFVDPATVPAIVAATASGPHSLALELRQYEVGWRAPDPILAPCAVRYGHIAGRDLTDLRMSWGSLPIVESAGWSTSWMGGPARRAHKQTVTCHSEIPLSHIEATATSLLGPNGEQLVDVGIAALPDAIVEAVAQWCAL